MNSNDTYMIYCNPVPEPKKGISKYGGVFYHDKSKNKRATHAWLEFVDVVKDEISLLMSERNLLILKTPLPYRIGISFVINKPKSNKLQYPSCRPDHTNMTYGIENCLQGLLYEDDGQRIGTLDEFNFWATPTMKSQITIVFERIEI